MFQHYRHRTDERNSRENHKLWISRAGRETQTLNPEKTDGEPKKIKQISLENQRNPETLENPRVFLSGGCLYGHILSVFLNKLLMFLKLCFGPKIDPQGVFLDER